MSSPLDIIRRLWWEKSDYFGLTRITFIHRGAPDDTATIRGDDVDGFDRSLFSRQERPYPLTGFAE